MTQGGFGYHAANHAVSYLAEECSVLTQAMQLTKDDGTPLLKPSNLQRYVKRGFKHASSDIEDMALTRRLEFMGTTLDVVIDPLALRGYRWFLGQIYGYPEPGFYFGIPLANFAGWLLVSVILIRLLQFLLARLPTRGFWDWGQRRFPGQAFLGPGLYGGILAFNLTMTLWIGELALFLAGVFIYLPFLTWLVVKIWPGPPETGSRI